MGPSFLAGSPCLALVSLTPSRTASGTFKAADSWILRRTGLATGRVSGQQPGASIYAPRVICSLPVFLMSDGIALPSTFARVLLSSCFVSTSGFGMPLIA